MSKKRHCLFSSPDNRGDEEQRANKSGGRNTVRAFCCSRGLDTAFANPTLVSRSEELHRKLLPGATTQGWPSVPRRGWPWKEIHRTMSQMTPVSDEEAPLRESGHVKTPPQARPSAVPSKQNVLGPRHSFSFTKCGFSCHCLAVTCWRGWGSKERRLVKPL